MLEYHKPGVTVLGSYDPKNMVAGDCSHIVEDYYCNSPDVTGVVFNIHKRACPLCRIKNATCYFYSKGFDKSKKDMTPPVSEQGAKKLEEAGYWDRK